MERRIAIIGSGFSGLCLGIQLKQAGLDSFTIFEKSDRIGGTWRENRYPGSACDLPSMAYCFSFEQKTDWSRKWVPAPEILERIAIGVIWVLALLAVMLSLERLYQADAEDGSLELMALGALPLELVALAKCAAHWLTTGLLLVIASPLLAVLMQLPGDALAPLALALLLGTPILTLIGSDADASRARTAIVAGVLLALALLLLPRWLRQRGDLAVSIHYPV